MRVHFGIIKKLLLLLLVSVSARNSEAQIRQMQDINVLASYIDARAFLLHVADESKPKGYTQQISYFIDTTKGRLTKIITDTYTDKWTIAMYYFHNDALVQVRVDFRDKDNVTIRQTEVYYYEKGKPLMHPYEKLKKADYTRYLHKGEELFNKSKLYTGI